MEPITFGYWLGIVLGFGTGYLVRAVICHTAHKPSGAFL
jgi:hypothetical protein